MFLLVLTTWNCFNNVKKNVERLKDCQFQLINVSIKKSTTRSGMLLPNLEISPIIEIRNPNEESVELYAFELELFFLTNQEKEFLGKMKNTESIAIPANESKIVSFVLDLNSDEFLESKILTLGLKLLAAASRGEDSEFALEGTVSLDSGFGSISIPIKENRKIRIR